MHGSADPPAEGAAATVECIVRQLAVSSELKVARQSDDHKVADLNLHWFAMLIERGGAELDHPLVRFGSGGPNPEHFTFYAQLVVGTNSVRPTQFVKASADDTAGRFEVAP